MPSLYKIKTVLNAKSLCLLYIVVFCLSMTTLFSQNNLPVDMQFVSGGAYGTQVHDSITGVTKTRFLYDIPDFTWLKVK